MKTLNKYPEVLAVYRFGSYVYGKNSKLSDTDIGVILNKPEILSNAKKTLSLYEDLYDIFAPFAAKTKKLDLVFLQKTPLSLQKDVLLNGELIHCQNREKLAEYKEKLLLKYADIKPVLDEFYDQVFTTRLAT
ncbi:nucleotidyltransferase domain-containing protein [Candidatus Roizmanbacteria bacterium]|nr:nucleotidyltransferase domain-containing protein [Candidatus Roizmanbacteria bacterium]